MLLNLVRRPRFEPATTGLSVKIHSHLTWLVFHAAELKPASFADKKYLQGCQISKQKSVLRVYCTYIVLNGPSLQRLCCFDYEKKTFSWPFIFSYRHTFMVYSPHASESDIHLDMCVGHRLSMSSAHGYIDRQTDRYSDSHPHPHVCKDMGISTWTCIRHKQRQTWETERHYKEIFIWAP